jgi:RNA-directed DNA polymerase
MSFLESRNKLFLPSIIGETMEVLDKIITELDNHYTERIEEKINPKTGKPKTYLDGTIKQRVIRPSKKRLKLIQSKIKDRILSKIELPSNVHGGVKKKSNITNAKPHQGNKYVFVTDLKDFYPSIKSKKIHELFIELGYNKQFALYITKLTTWKGELPQGTPTSTHISNVFFLKTDYELIKLCKENNITYTRYVDDLTFSSPKDFQNLIPTFLAVIKDSGLKISYRKTNYQSNQNVTGIVVSLHKIDAPKKLIEKSKLEIDNPPSCKPYTNYRESILKTNR